MHRRSTRHSHCYPFYLIPSYKYINNLPIDGGKSYQLRVRLSNEERKALETTRIGRGKAETISDIVRESIRLIVAGNSVPSTTELDKKVKSLAILLKRETDVVEKSCIEGIFDLIEKKTSVPLIVMESQLHLSYGNPVGGSRKFTWEV